MGRNDDAWIFFREINFADPTIMQFHVDTRDFHVATNTEACKEEKHNNKTMAKYGNRFFFTAEEVTAYVERYFTDGGGVRPTGWRFFTLKEHTYWFKYIRIYRYEQGLLIANSEGRAQNRETLDSAVHVDEYS